MKKTKIVCTLGPATHDKKAIEELVKAGMNVARLNFSHGDYPSHMELIRNIRAISKKLDEPVAILQDLQGPRIRIGKLSQAGIRVHGDEEVILVQEEKFESEKLKTKKTVIPVGYKTLYREVKKDDLIMIDDAMIELKVLRIQAERIYAKVMISGVINSHKGMNFPHSEIMASAITDKDKKDLIFGLSQGVDFVAMSFVKDAAHVNMLRNLIKKNEKDAKIYKDYCSVGANIHWKGTCTRIIVKVERVQAINNFDEILEAADGIMVARGDLGIEMRAENLPLAQKEMIKKCIIKGKPVITATQMLDSMVRNPLPTRAEVSDVANAILDGTDAVMLSAETASGKYPIRAVEMMTRIAQKIEPTIDAGRWFAKVSHNSNQSVTEAVSFAVNKVVEDVDAKIILCATTSGFTARAIARYKPKARIVAATPSLRVRNQLLLSWNVTPFVIPFSNSFDLIVKKSIEIMLKKKMVQKGDRIVITAGHPFGYVGETNLLKVHTI